MFAQGLPHDKILPVVQNICDSVRYLCNPDSTFHQLWDLGELFISFKPHLFICKMKKKKYQSHRAVVGFKHSGVLVKLRNRFRGWSRPDLQSSLLSMVQMPPPQLISRYQRNTFGGGIGKRCTPWHGISTIQSNGCHSSLDNS